MLQIISTVEYGPDLDKVQNIDHSHVIHRYDYFEQNHVDAILKKGCPKYFLSDAFTAVSFQGVQVVGLPLWLEREAKKIITCTKFSDELITTNCFNFMINKKRLNRFLCIKLVEWFKLTDYDYTWSAVDQNFDMSYIIAELDQLGSRSPLDESARSFILSSITLEKRFFHRWEKTKTQIGNQASIEPYGGNVWTWQNGLNQLFSRSAISLITETVVKEKGMLFTEKTLFAVLGLTFPIWVGGYEQAKEWTRLGFDTFDDIIDHSYQSHSTLIERCYYAIANNIDLLSDKSKIHKLRLQNKHRLLKNREFLLANGISRFVDQQIAQFPADLQQVMPDVLKFYRTDPI